MVIFIWMEHCTTCGDFASQFDRVDRIATPNPAAHMHCRAHWDADRRLCGRLVLLKCDMQNFTGGHCRPTWGHESQLNRGSVLRFVVNSDQSPDSSAREKLEKVAVAVQ